jgi:hypothetical protein
MDPQDRVEFLAVLNQTRDDFLSSIAGVTDEQSRQKPNPDRWSILECAEHVVAAERIMYIMVTERCTPRTTPPTTRERDFFALASDRSKKADAPERVRPVGRIGNLHEAAEKFREHRARSIEFVNTCQNDLRALEIHHPIAGMVTAQECLAILAMHPGRHAAQIRELRESLGIA